VTSDKARKLFKTINHVCHKWQREDSEFLGFIETDPEIYNYVGVTYEGLCFVAVHVFKEDSPLYGEKLQPDQKKLKPYVLMFYGTDNSSYYLRRDTLEQAKSWFKKTTYLSNHILSNAKFYNS